MKKFCLIMSAATVLMASSCSDNFFDINSNPNKPTEEAITPDFLMTGVVANIVRRETSTFDFLGHWMGYYARGSNYGPSLPLENYNITSTYQTAQWSGGNLPNFGWFDIMSDNAEMERKAKETGEQFYVGAAKVLKSIGFMRLVDMYNNVPYTEAFSLVSGGIATPKYDKGEDIYADLIKQLDTARTIFADPNLVVPQTAATSDLVFGGDVELWRKLVNTQALRLLIHQSEKVGNPSDELAKINADDAGFLGAGETAWVNPGYSSDQYKVNPMYLTYVADNNGILMDGFNRANRFLLDKYMDNDDLRYQYVFLKAQAPRLDDNGEPILWNGDYVGREPDPSTLKSSGQSIIMGTGLVPSADADAWLFTSVESMFLQAEAAERGWISGDAQGLYENAVKESFNFLMRDADLDADAEATTYLEKDIASWAKAANKRELIINQKYLALPGIDNFEAWVDYRRLGYPTDVPLTLSTGRGGRKIPLRLSYPVNEYSYNATNVEAEGDIDPQTDAIWWDVN